MSPDSIWMCTVNEVLMKYSISDFIYINPYPANVDNMVSSFQR